VELLHELRHHTWTTEKASDIGEFSSQLVRSVLFDNKSRFLRLVQSLLLFEELRDREEGIPKAHQKTLNWMFDRTVAKDSTIADFSKWLESEDGSTIYWITGKPGSGKSTLMKYIHQDPRTARHLSLWCPDDKQLARASFFFWNPGSKIQRSREGLLRSLLYQLLRDGPTRATDTFAERWELFDAYGGGLRSLSWEELRRGFTRIIHDSSRCFFFLLDGLDEFDGDHKQLSDLVLEAAMLPHVKLVISSRPWLVFEDSFEGRPRLTMEKVTENDINAYVTGKFLENKHYLTLQMRNRDQADQLILNVTRKSAGVFLWVYLVVNSLLTGLSNSDRISDLQQRLEDLPSELSELFTRLLNSLEPRYYQHACQIVLIVEAYKDHQEKGDGEIQLGGSEPPPMPSELPLLLLAFADEEDLDSVAKAKYSTIDTDTREARQEEMRRRLNSSCRGLFEQRLLSDIRCIIYLHRTAREYVKTPSVWNGLVSNAGASFDADVCLCIGSLMGTRWEIPGYSNHLAMTRSLYHARMIKKSPPSFFMEYLDEAVFSFERLRVIWLELLGYPSVVGRGQLTLLEYAVLVHGKKYTGRSSESIVRAGDVFGPTLTRYACEKIESMAPLPMETRKQLLSLKPNNEVVAAIQGPSAGTRKRHREISWGNLKWFSRFRA